MSVRGVSLAALLTLGAGCATTPRPAEPIEPVGANRPAFDAAEYELLDRFDALARYTHRAHHRCDRLAAGVASWVEGNRFDLPRLMAEAKSGSNLTGDELANIDARIEDVLVGLDEAMAACENDSGAQAVFARFDALLESDADLEGQ
jgi:hypothetical protein